MGKEKCWNCRKMKTNVKLRACDDRLCKQCYEKNEAALRAIRLSNNMATCGNLPRKSTESVMSNACCTTAKRTASNLQRKTFNCSSCLLSWDLTCSVCMICDISLQRMMFSLQYLSRTSLTHLR